MTKELEIKNDHITLKINLHGAELIEIKDNITNIQYLWCGDSKYWGRTSPVLFPVIGTCKNNILKYKDKSYEIPKHGFARDMDFSVVSHDKDEIWLELFSDEKTRKMYPFDFRLRIGYKIEKRKVTVSWRVLNAGEEKMYFAIGGHPAFMCPLNNEGNQEDYYIYFHEKNALKITRIDMLRGLVDGEKYELLTDEGRVNVENSLFDYDALVLENRQVNKISLLRPDKTPYITLESCAPVFGIWSVYKSDAPFVCVEPWYGRCDSSKFEGTIEEREWNNALDKGEEFKGGYTIEM